eukprot:symbB.v1.2.033936.t1/scaffold4290.1/size41860/1
MEDEFSPAQSSKGGDPPESGGSPPLEPPEAEAPDVQVTSFPRSAGMPSRMREAYESQWLPFDKAEPVKDGRLDRNFARSAGVPKRMRAASGEELVPFEAEDISRSALQSEGKLQRTGLSAVLYKVLQLYSRQVERRPLLMMLIFTASIVAIVAPLFRIPVIEFDFSTFIRADGDSMSRRDAYLLALAERKGPNARRRLKESTEVEAPWAASEVLTIGEDQVQVLPPPSSNATEGRRLFAQLIYTKSMSVLYETVDGSSIFGKQALQEVGSFEVAMRNLPGWKQLCGSTASALQQFCDPGESMMAYAWATQVAPESSANTAVSRFVMNLDANGQEPIPVPAFLAYIKKGGWLFFKSKGSGW